MEFLKDIINAVLFPDLEVLLGTLNVHVYRIRTLIIRGFYSLPLLSESISLDSVLSTAVVCMRYLNWTYMCAWIETLLVLGPWAN